MIVVDTSALMAIVQDEAGAEMCSEVLATTTDIRISAVTLAEALIVADRRNASNRMQRLRDGIGWQVAPVSEADAVRVAEAYARWGKGIHPAGLNFGDCFAYALAHQLECPLLFVGDDFRQTDIGVCLK